MSAKILDFPGTPAVRSGSLSFVDSDGQPGEHRRLQIDGYVLIAWRRDPAEMLHGLWKPTDGKGWYRCGWYGEAWKDLPSYIQDGRMSRAAALFTWRYQCRDPYNWHRLMSEAQAFPEKRRRYVRPPRLRVPSMA